MRPRPVDLVRPCIAAMSAYVPGEQPSQAGFIKLNTNENPYPPSEAVLARVRAACTGDLRLYPDSGATAVRQQLAALFGVSAECTIVGNGSDELLSILLRAFVGPGQRVAYPVPTYSYYQQLIEIQDGAIQTVEFDQDYTLPAELADTDARVILLANPNSPSGTLIPLDEIDKLAALCGGIIVLDEAYVDFSTGGGVELLQRRPNVIVLRTMSKSFSLAGMRLGFGFAAPEIIAELWKIKDHYNINRLGLVAAQAALDDVDSMRSRARQVCQTRDRLTAELRAMGFSVLDSEANFVLARSETPSAARLYAELKDRRILVRYFDQPRLQDCLRITVGTEDQTQLLIDTLKQILAERG
jgi:histidinol-phosphate aminotransferase